jgi:hypothetical protein
MTLLWIAGLFMAFAFIFFLLSVTTFALFMFLRQ